MNLPGVVSVVQPYPPTVIAAKPSGPSVRVLPVAGGGSAAPCLTAVYTAGQALSGHRAVTLEAGLLRYATPTDPVILLTIHAAASGAPTTVVVQGLVSEPSWSWVPGPVWVRPNGVLTQVLPTTGTLTAIGSAVSSNSLIVARSTSIVLG